MQNRRVYTIVLAVLLCTMGLGCASTDAPNRWLADPEELPSDPYGGWTTLKTSSGDFHGELIAISRDSVFWADSGLCAIQSSQIRAARLVVYSSGGTIAGGLVFGSLSTISNGVYLIFTAPMWLLGGSLAAISRTYDPIIDYPASGLTDFLPFARYPQGLPVGLDRGILKMKPLHSINSPKSRAR